MTLQTDTPLSLHHLHLTSEEPAALADFYADLFDLRRTRDLPDGMALAGGARALVIRKGAGGELAAAAYAARNDADLRRLAERLGDLARRAGDDAEIFFKPGAIALSDPQGRRLYIGVPIEAREADPLPARLQHVVFQTTALDAVLAFYVEKLGFTVSDEVVDEQGRVTTCFLRSDDEHHSMAFFRGAQNVLDHHCYETSSWNDIRDWGDRFARARRSIFFGPGRHGPGNNLFFMATDPDGNRIELSAELQSVQAGHPPGVWPHEEYTLNSWGRGWIRS